MNCSHQDNKAAPAKQVFNFSERSILQQVYDEDKYPVTAVIQHLADRLKVPDRQIASWFGKKRKKDHATKQQPAKINEKQLEELEMIYQQNPQADVNRIWEKSTLGQSLRQIYRWLRRFRKLKGISVPVRCCLTASQLAVLRQAFLSNPRPTAEERKKLAAQLNLKAMTVFNWFNSRRRKQKMEKDTGSLKHRNHQSQIVRRCSKARVERLEMIFQDDQQPNANKIDEVAKSNLGLSKQQICDWLCRFRKSKGTPLERQRPRLSATQLTVLRQTFQHNPQPHANEIIEVAKSNLGISKKQIYNWLDRFRKSKGISEECSELRFSPFQLNILNEELQYRLKNGKSSRRNRKRNVELSRRLGLSCIQITEWIRKRLPRQKSPISTQFLSDQKAVLQKDFAMLGNLTGERLSDVSSPLSFTHSQESTRNLDGETKPAT